MKPVLLSVRWINKDNWAFYDCDAHTMTLPSGDQYNIACVIAKATTYNNMSIAHTRGLVTEVSVWVLCDQGLVKAHTDSSKAEVHTCRRR